MTSRKNRNRTEAKGAHIGAEKVRSIVQQARKSSEDLVAAGVDRDRLEGRLSEIRKAPGSREGHDPVKLRSVLTELQADLIAVENRLIELRRAAGAASDSWYRRPAAAPASQIRSSHHLAASSERTSDSKEHHKI